MLMCIQNLVKFCPLVLKILNGNEILTSIKGHEILTSIKGHNSVANLQKLTLLNPNLDLDNANVYESLSKFVKILVHCIFYENR